MPGLFSLYASARGLARGWGLRDPLGMPDYHDHPEPALSRALRERRHALGDPEAWEPARAEALADGAGYDAETALRVLRG
ncbi:hypothetical protein MOX02_18570 [Methylobacterium oxalidis]|jgi:hypothetical protein|uniref:Uncharacterized protein n=3 Tax=Methylobacterium TaxID=407 RepID=A0A512J1T0_9HYPH|nr:hypothetical protein MOX02_18570 [Methylobacterium oxalidis]GJD98979.1 hypothetical protein GMJLKIPL_0892 [Methylobacterium isbiliense]GJE33128.1 hypothetical protein LDDCCGHA_3327 [Methylobacterium oxalidis]GLS62402.1 hypothetical protein GCM10007888_07830 [Methylobacterium oxalidis]